MFRLRRIKAQVKQFAPVLFLIIALVLMVVGVSNNPVLVRVRTVVTDAFVPVLSVIYTPVRWVKDAGHAVSNVFAVYADNERLKKENESLKSLQDKVHQLTADNKRLSDLTHYTPTGEKHFVTARIVADNGGAFAKSVLVQVGSNQGVKKGNVVFTSTGVLGHVIEAGLWSSRILLITDYTSRIPVMVGERETLCILSGDNTSLLKLIAVPEGAQVKADDLVVTSGHGGVYPSGLILGRVIIVEKDNIYVQPFTDREGTEFVRVSDFGLDGLLPDRTAGCDKD